MLMAELFLSNILPCYAVERDLGMQASEGSGIEEQTYILKADKNQVGFGTLEQGSLAAGQDIQLTNEGTEDISLLWRKADYYDAITVDAPETDSLAPGESCVFTVEADTSLAPGIYNSFILFGDKADPYFERGIQVNISMEIIKPVPAAPVITSISISPGTAVVSKNATCAFTALVTGENDYSQEVVWSVSGQKSSATFIDGSGILNVGGDETATSLVVKAVSKQDSRFSASALVSLQASSYFIQLKASPENGGAVYGSGTVKEGGYAVISAAPNNGFAFEGWYLNNNRISANSQYVVDNVRSDNTYVAKFRPVNCRVNINVNNSKGGTATESRTVEYGGSITLEAFAKDGYQFDGWMENGIIISKDSKVQINNITDARNFTAMFSQNKFSLTLTCSPADTGTVSGQGVYQKGNDVRIKASPMRGYRFVGWTENGNTISTEKEYLLREISKDMCLVAVFEKEEAKTYTIMSAVSSANGKITPAGKNTVTEGSWVLYAVTPKSGYVIQNVYVDGKPVGAVSSYNFSDVRENHTISADFAAIPGQDNSGGKETDRKDKEDEIKEEADRGDAAPEQEDNDTGEEMETVEMTRLTGTLQYLNISVQEAERMIAGKDDAKLMNGALETGDLQVTIHNDFADTVQETSYGSFYENSGVPNFEIVLEHVLSTEEKMEMLQGNVPVAINFHVEDAAGEETPRVQKTFMEQKLPGMNIGQYFEVFLMVSKNNDTQMVYKLPRELKVVINVPEYLKAENRKFYILRLHTDEDGSQDFAQLVDEDDNPDTITFSTDRFSPYAIAYIDWDEENVKSSETPKDAADSAEKKYKTVMMFIILAAVGTMALLGCIAVKKSHSRG